MAGSPERYSPDGRWRWNGTEWLPVSSSVPAVRVIAGVNRGALAAMVALTAILCLVVAALAGLLALTRVPALQGVVPLPGTASSTTVSSLTRQLGSSAFECSEGYTSPVGVWFCFQTRAHDYSDIGIQAKGQDGLGFITIQVARNSGSDPDPGSYASRLFKQIAGDVVSSFNVGAAQAWIGSNLSSTNPVSHQFGNAQLTVQQGPDSNQQAMYEMDAALANTQKQSINSAQLTGVTEADIQHYYERRGWTCQTDSGGANRINCAQSASDADYSGTIFTAPDGRTVKFFYAGLAPHSGDLTVKAKDVFQGAIRLALHGGDATRTIDWVDSHLDGKSHDLVVKGVHMGLYPGQDGTPLRRGGELELWLGAWSW
jgi:hypothetical protein